MQALVNVVQRVGPYFVVALVMPGGIFIALGAYLYRRLGRSAKRLEQVGEVGGHLATPGHPGAAARVREAQVLRMEHDARSVDAGSRVIADVDRLAHERMAELGEVDADLVLAPRLEAALHERRAA